MTALSDDWLLHEAGAADFADLYLEQLDAIDMQLLAQRDAHRVTRDAPMSEERMTAARADNRRRIRAAFEGRWSELAQVLAARGSHYGKAGASIRDWLDVSQTTHRLLNAAAARRFGNDPARLTHVLDVMSAFLDRSFCELAEAHERAVVAEAHKWQAVFQRVDYGMCLLATGSGVITHANAAFLALYGLHASDLGVRRIDELFDDEAWLHAQSTYFAEARITGRAAYESFHVDETGQRFPVLVEAARIPGAAGEKDTWSFSVHDLTERKQLEALRKHSTELETEMGRTREASRLKSEFLANMSHELRTPLNSILGFSELLYNGEVGPLEAQQREFVGDIQTSGKHLLRLINDLLDLSKVEAGRMEFHPEAIDLAVILDEVVGVLRGVTTGQRITCRTTIDESVRHIDADAPRLKQVLYNYLSNAIKFSAPGTEVHVRVRPDLPGHFRIEVVDQGVGIAASDVPRLFREFQQLEGDHQRSAKGTGLGLALTRRLIEAQGGTVGVASVPGEGSVFYAVLPSRSATTTSLPLPRSIPGARQDAPRVLVIEDDQADQDRIVQVLVEAGFAVETAATGAQAACVAQRCRCDVVTLDLLLPDTDGLSFLAALRRQPGMAEVPVIVISVVAEHVSGALLLHDVLAKPVVAERLLESLRRLSLVADTSQPVLVVDDDVASTKLMVQALSSLGFASRVAHDGIEALERLRDGVPCAIVLDLDMPRLDGFGFLRQLRLRPEWAHVPVIVWTVLDLRRDQVEALRANAQAIVAKNGEGGEKLLEIIRAHLPPRGRPEA